ncbi:MAG: SDR family NAD(P)-dependent oxidoreductase [Gammaproteobacteria bacterium]
MTTHTIENKVIIVTGGAGGIGSALVRRFLSAGAKVAVLDYAADAIAGLSSELNAQGQGANATFIECDVSSSVSCGSAVAQTLDRFGTVHALINNAALGMGVFRADHMTRLVTIDEIEPDIWSRFVAVNLNGAFFMTRAVVPHMIENGFGRIIDVTTSFFTMLRGSFHPYGPSKAGLEAMAAGHAKEFADRGITVNVVVPGGPTDTPMVPEEAGFDRATLIRPEAMAPPMIWLLSDAAGATTGKRYVAADWNAGLAPELAAKACEGDIGWPELAQNPVWPGGKPEAD